MKSFMLLFYSQCDFQSLKQNYIKINFHKGNKTPKYLRFG